MKEIIFYCLIILFIGEIKAQVSIGSLVPPANAALLEIKNIEPVDPISPDHSSNITSTAGGIGLSRVMLKDLKSLEPFISQNSDEWINNENKIREKHAGLMVFNIYESPSNENNPDKILKKSIYIWNGSRWNIASTGEGKKYFYMPDFNLPLNKITEPQENDVHIIFMMNISDSMTGQVYLHQNSSSLIHHC